jgi:hypothetical protein
MQALDQLQKKKGTKKMLAAVSRQLNYQKIIGKGGGSEGG